MSRQSPEPETGRRFPIAAAVVFLIGGALVVALGLVIGASGGREGGSSGQLNVPELRGTVLPGPMAKPDFSLADTEGHRFDFREETEGYLTLLFFGFTYCPDVCPVHLANLAAALREVPHAVRTQTKVVFVTVDPERDTPERLREWLDAFDPRFVGLHGDLDEVNGILSDLRFPPAVHGEPDEEGRYTVGHPSHILAFTPDGLLRALYPFGMRISDWAHDLPRLLELDFGPAEDSEVDANAPIDAALAYVTEPVAGGPAALYVTIRNRSDLPDALIGATTQVAGSVELHRQAHGDGTVTMEPIPEIPIPAGGTARLAPGGDHLMLDHLARSLVAGDTFSIELRFRSGNDLQMTAVVLPYSDLVNVLGVADDTESDGR